MGVAPDWYGGHPGLVWGSPRTGMGVAPDWYGGRPGLVWGPPRPGMGGRPGLVWGSTLDWYGGPQNLAILKVFKSQNLSIFEKKLGIAYIPGPILALF